MINFLKNFYGAKPDFKNLLAGGAEILDVRTVSEFSSGHIKGSRNIPVSELENHIDALKKINKPFITVCQSGIRSASAAKLLKSYGIEAYNGGAWKTFKNFL